MSPAERWYTKRELARQMHVSVSSVERHIRPTYRVGGQNRYLTSDVERQLRGEDGGGAPDNVTPLHGATA